MKENEPMTVRDDHGGGGPTAPQRAIGWEFAEQPWVGLFTSRSATGEASKIAAGVSVMLILSLLTF
jgi:hypothetical protein